MFYCDSVLAHLKIQTFGLCMSHQITLWSNMPVQEKLFLKISSVYILKIYIQDIVLSQFADTFETEHTTCSSSFMPRINFQSPFFRYSVHHYSHITRQTRISLVNASAQISFFPISNFIGCCHMTQD